MPTDGIKIRKTLWTDEGICITTLEVKFLTVARRTESNAFAKNASVDQKQALEARRRSDTSIEVPPMTRRTVLGKRKRLGPGVQSGNLKKLTAGHHKEWSQCLNLTVTKKCPSNG